LLRTFADVAALDREAGTPGVFRRSATRLRIVGSLKRASPDRLP